MKIGGTTVREVKVVDVNSVFPEETFLVVGVIVQFDEVAHFSLFEDFQGMLSSI
jgi:hypothetical protein